MNHRRAFNRWALAIPLVLAALMYARFFSGFWLGDDFGFLHQVWLAAADGQLWAQASAQFFRVDPAVVFYRPMVIASVALNESIAGSSYAGWFMLNYLVHLGNCAMVALLTMRLAAACGRDGRAAGVLAAAFFALCPLLAEGVFWIAARADACVTLLTLTGVYAWMAAPPSLMRAAALPIFFVVALGFKESAVVFPLQMILIVVAWPARLSRAQILAVAACFALVALYFAARAHFFGDFWRVYTRDVPVLRLDALWLGVGSIAPWWRGLTQSTPAAALAHAGLSIGACLLIAAGARSAQLRLAFALLCASAGVVVATLLGTDGMAATGEGSRLAYTPVAWFALAIGVGAAQPAGGATVERRRTVYRRAAIALLLCATIAGAWVLQGELRTARSAQNSVRDMVRASREWSATHAGLTLLLVEETYGPVVATRNAQAWLVMPPVQPEPLLHRVLPTISKEFESRYDQLSGGLATRLEAIRPSRLDSRELTGLLARDAPRWPEHYACWAARTRRIVELPPPDPGDRARWAQALREGLGRCAA